MIANGFIVLSYCAKRVKQKETPSIALLFSVSKNKLNSCHPDLYPVRRKSSLTSMVKEYSVKINLIIKQAFSTVVQVCSS